VRSGRTVAELVIVR